MDIIYLTNSARDLKTLEIIAYSLMTNISIPGRGPNSTNASKKIPPIVKTIKSTNKLRHMTK
jgi:hypothetical protein